MVARLEAAASTPAFDPVGSYVFAPVTMRVAGERKSVTLSLVVSGAPGRYSGRIVSNPGAESPATELVIGGERIWATATFANDAPELRVAVRGDSVSGTWVLGFMNSGALTGRREAR